MGLTIFAALMGDAGAAAGEPLESYRATTESTGVPELSPLGRQDIDCLSAAVVVLRVQRVNMWPAPYSLPGQEWTRLCFPLSDYADSFETQMPNVFLNGSAMHFL